MKRLPRAAAVLAAAATLLAGGSTSALAAPPLVERATYRNPVSRSVADTFADPSVIRGKDGWWYAYGTSDPLREGSTTPAQIPVVKSRDLVSWRYVGEAFSSANRPSWATGTSALWAPDIRYVDGQYRLYYVVTDTTLAAGDDSAIGMATAPTPAGPWTDSGAPVVGPRPGASGNAGDFRWTFDPSAVTDGGRQYLFYGSYYGGVWVQQLGDDGRTLVGTPSMVAIDNKFEGAYVVRRGGYWYLFASTANCCAGPSTGYSVQVGRSRTITGPYVDQQGVPLTVSRAGGTPVLTQNGNRWVGAGHNAIATDLAGQDWIVYHALDRSDPYLNGTAGIPERPMLVDRLDWVDGWPAVRAGRGPSAAREEGPAYDGRWSTAFGSGVPARWETTGRWAGLSEPQSGGVVRSRGAASLLTTKVGSSARVEADLRSSSGSTYGLSLRTGSMTVRVLLDPAAGRLRLEERRGSRTVEVRTAGLPAGFPAAAWHSVALQVRNGKASASVTNARLGDPVAAVTLDMRSGSGVDRAGAFAGGAEVDVDNVSALPVARPVTRLAPTPLPQRLDRAASDSFSGSRIGPGWSWVRKDAAATVTDGVLRWPTETADLSNATNDAGVLLRSPGAGVWTVETKLTIDLGTDVVRNYQQGGLVAYVDDDQFVRLSHVAIWNTRQTEFGHETPYAGGTSYGGTIVGPPAETTWLRLTHRVDPANGEHELRGWTSRDGRTWVKGGVWTLPAGSDVRVGLVAHGGAGATAEFDYFRLYR